MTNTLIVIFAVVALTTLLTMIAEGLIMLIKKETAPEWFYDLIRIELGAVLIIGILVMIILTLTERTI